MHTNKWQEEVTQDSANYEDFWNFFSDQIGSIQQQTFNLKSFLC